MAMIPSLIAMGAYMNHALALRNNVKRYIDFSVASQALRDLNGGVVAIAPVRDSLVQGAGKTGRTELWRDVGADVINIASTMDHGSPLFTNFVLEMDIWGYDPAMLTVFELNTENGETLSNVDNVATDLWSCITEALPAQNTGVMMIGQKTLRSRYFDSSAGFPVYQAHFRFDITKGVNDFCKAVERRDMEERNNTVWQIGVNLIAPASTTYNWQHTTKLAYYQQAKVGI